MRSLIASVLVGALANAAKHEVSVGKDGDSFDPESLAVGTGDTVTYHFYSGNHSVTQTSLGSPCEPLEGGFFSGFTPTDGESPVTWTIVVNDTSPIWVYSGSGNSCANGMVHGINPPPTGNDTIDAFRELAANATESTSPEDGLPTGGKRVLKIDVGGDKLVFSPANPVDQLPGTVVQFNFKPKNNSVVQAAFNDPCHPLENGFSSGFIPTSSPGVKFSVLINDTEPIYFYDAQTEGSHCQSGMVGSINADNFDAFVDAAKHASESIIPPYAPRGGDLTVNGTSIYALNGAVLDVTALDDDTITHVPRVGENDQFVMGLAGGGSIGDYNWGDSISDNTTAFLQLLQFVDNILLETLFDGYGRLNGGEWTNVYPESIVDTIGSMAAQAYVHRSMATDSLQHFNKGVLERCAYTLPIANVDGFLQTALTLLLLQVGLYIDVSASVASQDPWLVPALATSLGAKTRMTAVINMMQNHLAAAAPREVSLPADLVYSYAKGKYVSFCAEEKDLPFMAAVPVLEMTAKDVRPGGERVTRVFLTFEDKKGEGKFVAWLGPYGGVQFTEIKAGEADVPEQLYGHVWGVVTREKDLKVKDVAKNAVAGPEMIWIAGP